MNVEVKLDSQDAGAIEGKVVTDAAPGSGVEEQTVREISAPRMSWSRTFASLKYPNYRLWFIGQLASLVGTWMQSTAQGYLVFQLTQSPAYLGYVGFAGGIPSWLLMLYGGVVADRFSRRAVLVLAQTAMMLLAFILAWLTFAGTVQPWHIIVLALALGVANAFDAPARQAFVLEMVEREDLTNALALNSTMFNAATATGPAIAGVTYALFGPAWCFVINGISYLAVIAALLAMKLKPNAPRKRTRSVLQELKEGLKYTASHSVIRTLMAIAVVVSLFGMAYVTLLPDWANKILGGDATTAGLLQSARGVGSMVGALMIAALGRFRWKGRLMTMGMFTFPVLLIVFSAVRWLPLTLLVLLGVGWGFMVLFNMLNTLIQTLVTDELRGRVMGIYSLTFFGALPIGALLTGSVAEQIGEPATVVLGAAISLAFAGIVFLSMPRLRKLE
jgi:predicted MFS family arabinose efflux permease